MGKKQRAIPIITKRPSQRRLLSNWQKNPAVLAIEIPFRRNAIFRTDMKGLAPLCRQVSIERGSFEKICCSKSAIHVADFARKFQNASNLREERARFTRCRYLKKKAYRLKTIVVIQSMFSATFCLAIFP